MNADFDVRTSKTLLENLRVFEDREAWSKFMGLYLPMVQAWARRFGLSPDEVEELTSRLLTKLVQALPRFEYDPGKGSFRGWLKTVTQRELATFARERRRAPADRGAGNSAAYDLLLQQADDVDDLVDSLYGRSEAMLRALHDALRAVEGECEGEERKSWEVFKKIFLDGRPIEAVAAEAGLSYHAAAMRVQRVKKKVRARAAQLALRHGLEP